MDVLGYFRKVEASASSAPPIPYFAEYALDAAAPLPTSVDIGNCPGLALYHLIYNGDGPIRVATYWSTKEHFLRDGDTFRKQFGAGPAVVSGFIDKFETHPVPLIKRVSITTLVLSIAAFFGAVQAISNYSDWLFSAPYLALKTDKTRINWTEGEEVREPSTLVNLIPVAHRNIELSAFLQSKDAPNISMQINPNEVPNLPGANSLEVTTTGLAPTAGQYELVVHANASAGRVRATQAFQLARPVTVWPKIPAGTVSVMNIKGDAALLSGSIAVGPAAPTGLDCEMEINRVSGLRYEDTFGFSKLYGTASWLTNETPANEVASLQWSVFPLAGHERLPFRVGLLRTGPTDWNKISKSATVRCQYRKEKLRDAS